MKGLRFLYGFILIAVLMPIPYARADDVSGKFSGNIGFFTDYVYRGVSQTDDSPALQGNVDFSFDDNFKIGVWGSNVDFDVPGDGPLELDFYASYNHELFRPETVGELGIIYYVYPGAKSSLNYDYVEVYASLSQKFDPVTFLLSLNYSPDFSGSGDAWYPRLTGTAELPQDFSVEAWFGRQYIDDEAYYELPDYNDWAVGISYNPIEAVTIRAQYTNTDISRSICEDNCGAKGVLSVNYSF